MGTRMTGRTEQVLAAFLVDPLGEHYGLDIARRLGIKGGTLYPLLIRMEEAGWLTSSWEDIDPVAEGRRPRRYYKLTNAGAAQASVARDRILHLREGLAGV